MANPPCQALGVSRAFQVNVPHMPESPSSDLIVCLLKPPVKLQVRVKGNSSVSSSSPFRSSYCQPAETLLAALAPSGFLTTLSSAVAGESQLMPHFLHCRFPT